ncbi:AbrB/MazE/SpoVT family DNA-binding domain-containing protein [Bacillus smithii]|uniref:AbrB/MazE/SpoVT family DNA-binding domain-containing protein n=1 Tax=Bacillus smithii TaxID=1479 RepID=UPI0030C8F8EE
MKALGIVRKIDDLGRVVIPKEIRDSQGWKPGQPMEMFLDDDKLVIKPYGKEQEKLEVLDKLDDLVRAYPKGKQLIAEIKEYIFNS